MGDISIIARRLEDGHVQYGWSGNGGYYCNTGCRLLAWYQEPEQVEYLFELGQTRLIGKVGSEHGGSCRLETHALTGEAFWLGNTERMIFSKIAFIDYGYFYDLDHHWYYIHPGPFRVKLPLELVDHNLDDRGYEFEYLAKIEKRIIKYIFEEYLLIDKDFQPYLEEKGIDFKNVYSILLKETKFNLYKLYNNYRVVFDYFDDWILIKANNEYTELDEIIMHKNTDVHVETNTW